MKILSSQQVIIIETSFPTLNLDQLFDYFTEPYLLTQWLANECRRTPQGFNLIINFPLHILNIPVSIVSKEKPTSFQFLWTTEYVMSQSLVEITFTRQDHSCSVIITEHADFTTSRWKDPQSIHIDIWKNALKKLDQLMDST